MSIPGFDPNTAGNHEEIEMQFAVKTVEHLEVGTILKVPAYLTTSPRPTKNSSTHCRRQS